MVVIVAFLLAFVSSSLKAIQNKNQELDTKKQILAALNIKMCIRDRFKFFIDGSYLFGLVIIVDDPVVYVILGQIVFLSGKFLADAFQFSRKAVSYTHLDVYKRQE